MSVHLDDVCPSVIVVIDEAAAPGHISIVDADAGGERDVTEGAVSVVVIKVAGIIGEVGFEDVEPAIAIVVGDGDAHSGLFLTVLAVGDAGHDGNIGEGPIVVVAEENAWLGIARNIDVGPAIVIEVGGNRGDRVARTWA